MKGHSSALKAHIPLRRLLLRTRVYTVYIPLSRSRTYVSEFQRPETRDGRHGQRATRAIPGSPAGFIAVELSESTIHEEGLHVVVVEHRSIQQPPPEVEVPTQQDLFIQAVGGAGESGHVGGNGEPGMRGTDGAPATRESDATVAVRQAEVERAG